MCRSGSAARRPARGEAPTRARSRLPEERGRRIGREGEDTDHEDGRDTDAGEQPGGDRESGPHGSGGYQHERPGAARGGRCYDAAPMADLADRIRTRVLPALLIAFGVTLLAGGLLSYVGRRGRGSRAQPVARRRQRATDRHPADHVPAARLGRRADGQPVVSG